MNNAKISKPWDARPMKGLTWEASCAWNEGGLDYVEKTILEGSKKELENCWIPVFAMRHDLLSTRKHKWCKELYVRRLEREFKEEKTWNCMLDGTWRVDNLSKRKLLNPALLGEMKELVRKYGANIKDKTKLDGSLKELGEFSAGRPLQMELLAASKITRGAEATRLTFHESAEDQIEMLCKARWPKKEIQAYMEDLWLSASRRNYPRRAVIGQIMAYAVTQDNWVEKKYAESFGQWFDGSAQSPRKDYDEEVARNIKNWHMDDDKGREIIYKIVKQNPRFLGKLIQNKNITPKWVKRILKEAPSLDVRRAAAARSDCLADKEIREMLRNGGRCVRTWMALLEASTEAVEASQLVGYLSTMRPDLVRQMIKDGTMPEFALIPNESIAKMLLSENREERLDTAKILSKIDRTDAAVGPLPKRGKIVRKGR